MLCVPSSNPKAFVRSSSTCTDDTDSTAGSSFEEVAMGSQPDTTALESGVHDHDELASCNSMGAFSTEADPRNPLRRDNSFKLGDIFQETESPGPQEKRNLKLVSRRPRSKSCDFDSLLNEDAEVVGKALDRSNRRSSSTKQQRQRPPVARSKSLNLDSLLDMEKESRKSRRCLSRSNSKNLSEINSFNKSFSLEELTEEATTSESEGVVPKKTVRRHNSSMGSSRREKLMMMSSFNNSFSFDESDLMLPPDTKVQVAQPRRRRAKDKYLLKQVKKKMPNVDERSWPMAKGRRVDIDTREQSVTKILL